MTIFSLHMQNLVRYYLVSLLTVPCLARADIFVSTDDNGTLKWSTNAVDATYTKTSIIEIQPANQAKSLTENLNGVRSVTLKRKTVSPARLTIIDTIQGISSQHGIDPELVEALIAVESNFNTNAVSPKGARGLMQLMPATAKRYGMKNEQELHLPAKNIDMGVRHLKDLLNLHNGQVSLAIASYNAGQGAVSKYGQRIPQYRETMIYVPAVLAYMARSVDATPELKQE
jgi:soluble lytic murein transglycosylase-like protein